MGTTTLVLSLQLAKTTPVTSSGVHVSNPVASTRGQVLVGGSVFNLSLPSPAISPMPAVRVQLQTTPTVCSRSNSFPRTNPFILKFKTNLIKICQSTVMKD